MDWTRDVRLALRGLIRRPGFACVAITTLSIGIGANTAMYALLDAVVLTPLPFPDPARLVQVWETAERDELELRSLSFPMLEDLTRAGGIFESVAGINRTSLNLSSGAVEPERVVAEMVSPSYFSLLRVEPLVGRLLFDEDDRADLPLPPVVLSEALWRRRYGSDGSVVGQRIQLNEVDGVVVGIAAGAAGAAGVERGGGLEGSASLWVPLKATPLFDPSLSAARFEERGVRWLDAVGRLREDVSLERAHAFMATETARLREAHPRDMEERGVLVVGLEEGLLGDVQRTISSLMVSVLLVLVITCANLAGLLLARGAERKREMALRLAVGASRGRLARQLLTESLVLSFLGGALGFALATAAGGALERTAMLQALPSYVTFRLGLDSLVFASAAALSTAFLFGAGPSLALARSGLVDSMRTRAASRASGARGALVVVQVALAVALTIGSLLVLRSSLRALAVDPGFSPEAVSTLRIELPAGRYDGAAAVAFARALEERLEGRPGIRRAALASDVPLVDGYSALVLRVEDRFRRDAEDRLRAYHHRVTPGFFSALGVPLLRGRDFAWSDAEGTPLVVVVTEQLAAAAWPGEDPIGKRVSTSGREGSWREVIGVVGNVRYRNLLYDPVASPEDPDVYFPLAQQPTRDLGVIVALAPGGAVTSLSVDAVRGDVSELDAAIPVFGVRDMTNVVSEQLATSRVLAFSLVASGATAALLAALGIYGLLAQRVAEKRFEIGIRIAVGADRREVTTRVVSSGLRLAALGLVIGLAGSLAFGRYIESLLFDTSATDPVAFLGGGALLLAVAGVASYLPARRASRLDPARLLGSG